MPAARRNTHQLVPVDTIIALFPVDPSSIVSQSHTLEQGRIQSDTEKGAMNRGTAGVRTYSDPTHDKAYQSFPCRALCQGFSFGTPFQLKFFSFVRVRVRKPCFLLTLTRCAVAFVIATFSNSSVSMKTQTQTQLFTITPVSQDQTTTVLFFRCRCVVLKFQDHTTTGQ